MHVPSLPGVLQLPHLSQFLSQQTPSLQVFDIHCVFRKQACPWSNQSGHNDFAPASAVPPGKHVVRFTFHPFAGAFTELRGIVSGSLR